MPNEHLIGEWQSKFKHRLLQGKVEDRLYSLIHSDYVIADSFHGICFAIIFNKPFIAILNPLRGAARFYTILGKLNLLDRLVTSVDEVRSKSYLLTEELHYSEVLSILNEERDRCLEFLRECAEPSNKVGKAYSVEDILSKKFNSLNRHLLFNCIKVNAAYSGRKYFEQRNFYDYLDVIIRDKSQLIIVISVKDTPGYAFNEKLRKKFRLLGLNESLINKHWHSYVAVVSSGKVISEVLSSKEERVAYVGKLPCGNVKVVSRSFHAGNIAYIGINDQDYSENRRGINIVVYDKLIGEVVDTVCFDTHDESIPYFRFNKKFNSIAPPYLLLEQIHANQTIADGEIPSDIKKEEISIYLCCKLAANQSKGRKLFLWDDNARFVSIFIEHFNIKPENIIINADISTIKGKKKEYYVIIPNRRFDATDQRILIEAGYRDIHDYVYYNIKPVILVNRNYTSEPYEDIYGNKIIGDFSADSMIIIRGYNNRIDLGKIPSVKSDASLSIDCSHNNEITIGSKVRYVGKVSFICLNQFEKKIEIGDKVIFINNEIRVVGDIGKTEIKIGKRTTFNENTCLRALCGKRLIIGEDVMFSINIQMLCGDGHSLFDVKTGENINSIPSILSNRRNSLIIGDHVWIGMNATLMAGTNIGSGSIVGANSLVKGEFPNNCAIGGNPAKLIKTDVAWSRRDCSLNISNCGGYEFVNTTWNCLELKNKKVLVLGGTKFMGPRLVEKLLENEADVTIATRGIHPDSFGNHVFRIIVDRNNEKLMKDSFINKEYDIVYDASCYNPLMLRYALSYIKCKRYIFVSTSAVYNNSCINRVESMVDPYHIAYVAEKNLPYGISKKYSECVLCQEFGAQNSAIVRVPAVIDESNLQEGKISNRLLFYADHIINEIPFCERNLDRVCSFARTTDEADFLIFLSMNSYNGVFNFASKGIITLKEIIDYIEAKTDKKAIIDENGEKNDFPFGGYTLDTTKAESIGIKPTDVSNWIYPLLDKYIQMVLDNLNNPH